jgi:hypothetical protein
MHTKIRARFSPVQRLAEREARTLFQFNECYGMDMRFCDIFSASSVALMAELVQDRKDQDAGRE